MHTCQIWTKIFGHTLIKLADKLINTKNEGECKIIVKNINKNIDKINEMVDNDDDDDDDDDDDKWADLYKAVDLILDFDGRY